MKEIKKYKGISLKYDEQDGYISFDFEDTERKTKYIFEAERIIDEPQWEECDLQGYFSDGYIDKFIGKAIAKRKNTKNSKPDWKIKGQYDTDYKNIGYTDSHITIVLRNENNDEVYRKWQTEREIYQIALRRLNNVVAELK